MIINNALINGKIQNIVIEDGKIIKVTEEKTEKVIDAKGQRVIPGLIDVHTHGCIGLDVMDANLAPMCRYYAEHGTTSWLPTTMTMDFESLERVSNCDTNLEGANILGFHFEGPYLSLKRKGAMNENFLRDPSIEEFSKFKNVKMITVAPELSGAEEFIKTVSKDCIVSIGHTDCDYDLAVKAIEWGANCLTHTYNAMPPFLHRAPGPIGAGVEKHIYAQLICDGFHIEPSVVLGTYRMFGPDRMVMISDSVCCAGLPDGKYDNIDGLPKIVKDKTIRLEDGTIAGSYICLWDGVKKAVEFGIPFEDAVRMSSQTPAEMLGIKKGKIEEGYDADLLIISDDMEISSVIIGGELYR